MKVRSEDPKKLSDFKCLAFDCFGTLIDWETGLYSALQPLRSRLPATHPLKNDRAALISAFDAEERALIAAHPTTLYPHLLTRALTALSTTLSLPHPPAPDELTHLADSIPTWPAFPDTVRALQRLSMHYKLVVLTNCDTASFHATLAGPLKDVNFDAVYIAEEIGSYKPDLANFRYLLEHVGEEVLMVAHGLRSDHVPAREMGIASAWIARGDGDGKGGMDGTLGEVEGRVGFTWVFDTMGEMTEEVDREFNAKNKPVGSV